MRKANYRFERAERDRAKQAKKEEKLRRHQERAAQPKSDETGQDASPLTDDKAG